MKFFFCTALVGDYDFLPAPKWAKKNKDFRFICFTDQKKINPFWEKRNLPKTVSNYSKLLKHKYVKVFCDKIINENGIYIWIDANIYMKEGFEEIIEQFYKSSDLFLFIKHPLRKNIKQEAKALANSKYRGDLDKINLINEQIKIYERDGFDCEKDLLIEANVFMRKSNNLIVEKSMNLWWEQIMQFPARDQISLPYVLSEIDPIFSVFDIGSRKDNRYFNHYGHKSHNIKDIHAYLYSKRHIGIFKFALFFWQPLHNIINKYFYNK